MSSSEEKRFLKSDSFQLFFRTLSWVFCICMVICIFYGAYVIAEQTFSNPAYDTNSHKLIRVIVKPSDSEEDVATELVKKKLIYGKNRFRIRKYFSKYQRKAFQPGTYEFSQSQGMDDIMGILCGDQISEEIIQ